MVIGIYLRHIKAYKGINYIPVGFKHNFISYIGENGTGKSSILEALNSFFNYRDYNINKNAIKDGIRTEGNFPFFAPIFLIEKKKVTRNKKDFEKISDFFWTIEKKNLTPGTQGTMKAFFELREMLLNNNYKKDNYYLMLIGEKNLDATRQLYFSSFHREEAFLKLILEGDNEINEIKKWDKEIIDKYEEKLDQCLNKDFKDFFIELKNLYSLVYIPVEIDVENFTKIETEDMQKVFDKKIKDEIEEILEGVNIGAVNRKLEDFINSIEKILGNEYYYDTGSISKKSLTKKDLVEKILEVYFQVRVLNKGNSTKGRLSKKVSEISAGEKRQALINLVYAFLKKESERDKTLIIGIDEPENSLHTSLCYEQFEKLKEICKNNQILITTHWYGFLPIISEGFGHFLNKDEEEKIEFDTYDLFDYRAKIKQDIQSSRNKMPKNYKLKSINDLTQSIFYSLMANEHYNWLICEGISEKIYLEYFFKDEIEKKKLRILPVGGASKVIQIYKYLELPIEKEEGVMGRVYCLIDTDNQSFSDRVGDGYKNLKLRRFFNEDENFTELLTLDNSKMGLTEIENALNPVIFKKTIELLETEEKYKIKEIINEKGNCHFIKNFRNLDIESYLNENNGENKIIFANKYVEIMQKENDEKFIPKWVLEIKKYFNE